MKLVCIFPKDSEALFNKKSGRTFGGANIQMYLIARELSNHSSIETFSFIPNYDEICFDESDRFNLIRTFSEKDTVLKKFWTYHKRIQEIKPDVIIQRGLTLFSCLLAFYCRAFRIKFVFMFAHDIESHGLYQKNQKRCALFPLLLRSAYLLIVQNEYELNNLQGYHQDGRIKLLKKGIDLSRIPEGREKMYDCIWIARCERWKNPELFIDLADANRSLRFLMICSRAAGKEDYFNEVRHRTSAVENLKFIDFVDYQEIYKLLAESRIFCLTSDLEGDWPMTVLEAAASRLPILSLKLNYGNLFSHYRAGFYCNGDVAIMNRRLKELIDNRDVYQRMSDNASQYIEENHDIKTNVERLIGFLQEG